MSVPVSFQEQLEEKIAAAFAGVWVVTVEPEDAVTDACRVAEQIRVRDGGCLVTRWNCVEGLMTLHQGRWVNVDTNPQVTQQLSDAVMRMQVLHAAQKAEANVAIMLIEQAHEHVNEAYTQQLLRIALNNGKASNTVFVFLSHSQTIPKSIETLLVRVTHELPDRSQLRQIIQGVLDEGEAFPADDAGEAILDAASGLTRIEAENAAALSLVRHGHLDRDTIFSLKAETIRNVPGLSLYDGRETFDDIGGLDFMKQFCKETLMRRERNPKFQPRGILIVGVSGGGKSLFAKALGREVNRPTLCIDIGATYGSLLGQSQSQWRQALDKADAMEPSIAFIDEVDKALKGVGQDAATSGGVKTENFGYLLTWFNDHKHDTYLICTANDVTSLVRDFPEFVGRFDQLFFVDYPDKVAQQKIWTIHGRSYELVSPEEDYVNLSLPSKTDQWTGREIEKACRLARQRRLPVRQVGEQMTTISDQSAETVEAVRRWAVNKCMSADYPDKYQGPEKHKAALAALYGGRMKRAVRRAGEG